jgi:hypothetical protein
MKKKTVKMSIHKWLSEVVSWSQAAVSVFVLKTPACFRAPPRSMLPSAMFLTQRKMHRSHP